MRIRLALAGLFLAAGLAASSPAAAQVTYNSVTLTWTAPGDDSLIGTATRYDIRYSTSLITAANFGSATAVASPPTPVTAGTSQTFNVTGLQAATTYWFAIKAQDDAGNWANVSNVVSKTTLQAPDVTRPAPIALSITTLHDTDATLSWNAVGDDSLTGTATSYDIRYSTVPITTSNWATASTVTAEPTPLAAGTAQTFTVTNLARQRQYYFAIKVTDDAGNVSALSNSPTGTTTDTLAPRAITDLTASFVWLGWPSGAERTGARR